MNDSPASDPVPVSESPAGGGQAGEPADVTAGEHDNDTLEDARTQRRRLAAVWVAAGSAVAAMVAVSWYVVVRNGNLPPGGDMLGHAAAAEWLRTLPWWDWRGWSDWFYGGQAIGVNYPPLGHAWLRFTHPVHGQMAAVAIGLLVLLPWGALRLARAVGYGPRGRRAAVAGVLVLTAAAGNMHWVLSGFHYTSTFFGSWPAMVATVLGLHCAAWAARCARPVACGVVAGLAILVNATVVPGVAVVCVALLVTSSVSFRQASRWAATAATAAVAVCAWWLVPFLAGWGRLVRWDVPLSSAWDFGGTWQVAVLAVLGLGTVQAARACSRPGRRVAGAAAAGLLATLLGDLFGYLRPERWLDQPVVLAAIATAGLLAARPQRARSSVRPAWAVLGIAFLIVFVVTTGRLEILPLAIWLLWWPRRAWAVSGALAWACVLLWVPFSAEIRDAPPSEARVDPVEAAAAVASPGEKGLVYLDVLYNTPAGGVRVCEWGSPWSTGADTGGRIRPLFGLYRETSPAAEFLSTEFGVRGGLFEGRGGRRPHWSGAWSAVGSPSTDSVAGAAALGARWYATCDPSGEVTVLELPVTTAEGVTVTPLGDEEAWHSAAVEWWLSIAVADPNGPGERPGAVPLLTSGESAAHPPDRAASGVTLENGGDRLEVHAETAGWAWLRVPWDPHWRSVHGSPVRKGGPGHLLVWAEEGRTELRWSVPAAVDVAAAATTGAAALVSAALAAANRRRGFQPDTRRSRPAAEAVEVFAGTVDSWAEAAGQQVRRLASRASRSARS